MSAYCTREQAIAAGAKSTDLAALDLAITRASSRVDAYTGTFFEPRTTTLSLEVDEGGLVSLPAEGTVTEVRVGDPLHVLPVTSWAVMRTRLYLPGAGLADADILVAGAEPYRGGWANLLGDRPRPVEVDGTFGPAEVPPDVQDATAILAANALPAGYVPATDAEGVPQGTAGGAGPTTAPEKITPWGTDRGTAGRLEVTTGDAEADRLLAPWRRRFAGGFRMG